TGRIIERRRVELWQSADHGLVARRLYDEQNRLIAGEWSRPDGSSELRFRRRAEDKVVADAFQTAGADQVIWRSALDARRFSALVGAAAGVVEERPGVYILGYQWSGEGGNIGPNLATNASNASGGRLIKATLTLNRSDLRAVEQTLLVRMADGA